MTLQQRFARALMEGELPEFPFVLAGHLGITLAQVGAMTNHEYLQWQAWFEYRTAMAGMKS